MDNNKQAAFPYALPHVESDHEKGLTKLEAFTMAAMQGLCVAVGNAIMTDGALTQTQEENLAYMAASIAEATLKELSKHQ